MTPEIKSRPITRGMARGTWDARQVSRPSHQCNKMTGGGAHRITNNAANAAALPSRSGGGVAPGGLHCLSLPQDVNPHAGQSAERRGGRFPR